MKKINIAVFFILALFMLTSCNNNKIHKDKTSKTGDSPAVVEFSKQITGLVLSVYGNEIEVQLSEKMGNNFAGSIGKIPNSEEFPDGEFSRPSGGKIPENIPEGMEERMQNKDFPNRENAGEKLQGQGENGFSKPNSGVGTEDFDISESIKLTEEKESYSIPVGTAVYSFGTEMTFSQITEGSYITIKLDDEDNIISVNILG